MRARERLPRFNGATAFEPWNPPPAAERLSLRLAASMGPRHLSRGIIPRTRQLDFLPNSLQWGHGI